MAREVASWSKDPKRKVGCVITTPDRKPISYGYNGFPPQLDDHEHLLNDDQFRRSNMVHSEINAITFANKELLVGATIYVWPMLPCPTCASELKTHNITRIVTTTFEPDHWKDQFLITKAMNFSFTFIDINDIRDTNEPYLANDPLDEGYLK